MVPNINQNTDTGIKKTASHQLSRDPAETTAASGGSSMDTPSHEFKKRLPRLQQSLHPACWFRGESKAPRRGSKRTRARWVVRAGWGHQREEDGHANLSTGYRDASSRRSCPEHPSLAGFRLSETFSCVILGLDSVGKLANIQCGVRFRWN